MSIFQDILTLQWAKIGPPAGLGKEVRWEGATCSRGFAPESDATLPADLLAQSR